LDYLKLWTIEERRARADIIELYKIIHGISSVSFDTFFEFNSYGTLPEAYEKESVDYRFETPLFLRASYQ